MLFARYAVHLMLLSVLLLGACAEDESEVLKFGLSADPVTLDPRFATDAASTRINRLLYSHLVDFDERYQPVPSLASWEAVSPVLYRFTLQKVAHFHNGALLTAQDVKATYDSVLDPDTASPHRAGLEMIEGISVRDQSTVDFQLARPDALFPGRLVIGILPAAEIESGHAFSRTSIGSGAFEFVAWRAGGDLSIRRVADGQVVKFVRVPQPTVRVLKLLRGELDMLQGDLPSELIQWLLARGDVRVQQQRGTNFAYLGFNLQDPVVGDLRVRQAIAHAIDRESIIRFVMAGAARPASAILTPEHWAGNPRLAGLSYDPERARALLREAGYGSGRPVRIVYKTSSDPFRIRLATILQEQLGRVGIEVDLRSYDWGTFYADVKAGRFRMYSLAWVGIKMPDIFKYALHSTSVPPTGANRGRFLSTVADKLMDEAENAASLTEQAGYYRELQKYLLEQLPYVPLWYEDYVFASREDIVGYSLGLDGNYDALIHVVRQSTQL
ncbi:MAG: ABC transporter substrate-binding protein [Lysobacterales bacterium]|nr:MAG: ABC transporter substrate-binding protein [Xanthomonadales bacterium]